MKWLILIAIIMLSVLWMTFIASGIVFLLGMVGVQVPLWVGVVILVLLNIIFAGKQ